MDKVFKSLGAKVSTSEREENDFYATNPDAVKFLLEKETFRHDVWECCCGMGHLSREIENAGYNVISSDIVDRGYPDTHIANVMDAEENVYDVITNPPYKNAQEIIQHLIDISKPGTKIAMFLKVLFLESRERRKLFDNHPPKTIYVSSKRIVCAKDGDFDSITSSAIAYAWYVWEVGYTGDTIVKWVN